jgi:hypothetical protein
LIGQFHITASGRTSYEIYEAEGEFVFHLVQILKDRFGYSPRLPVLSWLSLDEIYITCQKDRLRLTVGWDEWSGCFVMASNRHADAAVVEIGGYLDNLLTSMVL